MTKGRRQTLMNAYELTKVGSDRQGARNIRSLLQYILSDDGYMPCIIPPSPPDNNHALFYLVHTSCYKYRDAQISDLSLFFFGRPVSHQANHINFAIERAEQRLDSFFAAPASSKDSCRNPGGLREITLNMIHHLRGWGRTEQLIASDSGAFLIECTEIASVCDVAQSRSLLDIVHRLFKAKDLLQKEADQGMQKAEQIDRHLGEDWQDLVVALLLALRAEEPLAASA